MERRRERHTSSKLRAWIINIGTELVRGLVVNTNGAWLARELSSRGVKVERIVVVGDVEDDVVAAIKEALSRADIIVTTGGLGPTYDDRTMEFLAKALGVPLELNHEALAMVKNRYREWGLELTPPRVKMAFVPRGAKPIPNPVGAAPGAHVTVEGKHIFVLPGVPEEMKAMFNDYVVKVVEKLVPQVCVRRGAIIVVGARESDLAHSLNKLASKYSQCYIKSHPQGSSVKIEVVAEASSCSDAEALVNSVLSELSAELKPLEKRGGVRLELVGG